MLYLLFSYINCVSISAVYLSLVPFFTLCLSCFLCLVICLLYCLYIVIIQIVSPARYYFIVLSRLFFVGIFEGSFVNIHFFCPFFVGILLPVNRIFYIFVATIVVSFIPVFHCFY